MLLTPVRPIRRRTRAHVTLALLFGLLLIAACGGGGDDATPTAAPAAAPTVEATAAPTAAPTEAPTEAPTVAPTVPPAAATAAPAEESATAPAATAGDAAAAIMAALQRQVGAAPYRIAASTTADGATNVQEIEVASPQAMALKMAGMQIRVVDGKVYMNTNGQWQENPAMAVIVSATTDMFSPDKVAEVVGEISNASVVGEEDLDGVPTTVYEYTATSSISGEPITSTNRLWVRTADGLPVKQTSTSDIGGTQTTGELTITYDPSIEITAPQ